MTAPALTVLMTADAVGGVWSYAVGLCSRLPDTRFILAMLGPPPDSAQRAAVARLGNVELAESGFRLEWMQGGQDDVPASRRWLDELAERHGADIVHVNGFAQARLAGGRPVLAVGHSDVLSWWRAVHGEAAPPEWDGYRREVVAGLMAATRVAMPTRAVRGDLRRHYGLPLHDAAIVPNGIDIAGFETAAKRPVIMAAGRVWDAAKNLLLLDAIAPSLPWPIAIAGEPAHPEHGAARLQHARALGRLDPAALRQRLAATAIFAAPARYEPFGLGILEAAAAGCALALGDIPSLRESWDGAAVFLPPDEPDAWREALAGLIADDARRDSLAAAARGRARRFTIAATAGRYRALYRELAGRAAERRVA